MSASRWVGLGALVLAASLAGACSTVTVGGDAGGGGVDAKQGGDAQAQPDAAPPDPCAGAVGVNDFYTCLLAEVCDIYDQCICAFSDRANCLSAPFEFQNGLARAFIMDYLHNAIDNGVISYNASQARACLDFVGSASCGDLLSSNSDFDQMCQPFTGTVSAGGVCFADVDCAPRGSRCIKTNQTGDVCVAGSCVAPAPLGADCSTNQLCVPGAYCVQSMAGGYVCQSGAMGAPCQGTYQCDGGLYCDANNTCRPVVPNNGTCTDDSQCPPGLQCVGDDLNGSGTCRAVNMVNAPCDNACAGCLYCDVPDTTQLGTCQMLPGTGQSCTSQGRCADSFDVRCDDTNNMCVSRGGDNDPCTKNGGECRFGFFCTADVNGGTTGVCAAALAPGGTCNDSQQCASGLCVDDGNGSRACAAYSDCR